MRRVSRTPIVAAVSSSVHVSEAGQPLAEEAQQFLHLAPARNLGLGQVGRVGAVEALEAGGVDPPHARLQGAVEAHTFARDAELPRRSRLGHQRRKRPVIVGVGADVGAHRGVVHLGDAEEEGHRLGEAIFRPAQVVGHPGAGGDVGISRAVHDELGAHDAEARLIGDDHAGHHALGHQRIGDEGVQEEGNARFEAHLEGDLFGGLGLEGGDLGVAVGDEAAVLRAGRDLGGMQRAARSLPCGARTPRRCPG